MAFKMKGNPMQRNFGIGSPTKKVTSNSPLTKDEKIPESGTGKDDETGTRYYRGMAQSDRYEARSDTHHSNIEVEAAKELGSGRVNRAQKRADRKDDKRSKRAKIGGASRRQRVAERRAKASGKASDRADKITRKRFDKMSDLGKKNYNRVIEQDNKKRKEREAEKNA